MVTIILDEQVQEIEGWEITEDKLTLTKTYTANTEENVIIKDLAGNESTVNVEVLNIDKTAPLANVSYSTTTATNQNITVTITSNEIVQEVQGWTLSSNGQDLIKEYTSNTVLEGENITIKDLAGNESTVNVKILNIDKELPNLEINTEITTTTKYKKRHNIEFKI